MPAERDAAPGPAELAASRRTARRQAALALVVALLLLGVLVWVIGPAAIGETLRDVRWPPLLAAAGVLALAALLGAFNAWQLSELRGQVPFPRFVAAFWCGWAVGLIVPGQVADVLLLTGLLRRLGVSGSTALGRLGVDKLLSLVVVLAAVAALPLATGRAVLWPLAGVASVAALALLVATPVAAAIARSRKLRADAATPRWRATLVAVIERAGESFRDNPGAVLLNLLLSVVKLALTGFAYWLAFRAVGIDPPEFWRVAVVAVSAGLVAYVPVSLNGLGTVELAGVLLFGMLGITAPVVASAYLLLRAIILLVAWLPVGFVAPIAMRRAH
jgi:uncharacterized membrane protein YbhN (UPF0104 family)